MSAGKDLTFARGGETLRGHLAAPDGPAESPAVVLIPDVHGLSDLYREIAGRFAARGFATLAVDLYGREGAPKLAGPTIALDLEALPGVRESSAELGDVAGHAFLNHTRPDAYRPEAAADAFERSVAFFDAHLSPKA